MENEKFLKLIMKGDNQSINYLKSDKQLRNIKDDKGNNIVHYLIIGNQQILTKELLIKKLITYSLFKKTVIELFKSELYKNDKYYSFFSLLKEEDKYFIIKKELKNIIKNNNKKTFESITIEQAIEFSVINPISFESFTQCSEEMLEICMPLYKTLSFDLMSLKLGFNDLKLNKVRTSILLENLNMIISPFLYEELNKVNGYCSLYLENKELYNKLKENLIEKENKKFKKI